MFVNVERHSAPLDELELSLGSNPVASYRWSSSYAKTPGMPSGGRVPIAPSDSSDST